MHNLDETNAEAYLRDRGWIEPGDRVVVRRLAGGVSNEVLLVQSCDKSQPDFVLKQSRPQLRVADAWFCGVERIWREVEVLRICQELTSAGKDRDGNLRVEPRIQTPRILHEDRDNFCFAMTAAPAEHQVWKARLLAGEADAGIAAACGRLLAALHAGTWRDAAVARQLDDRQVFDELRLDPYYRTVAARCPEAAGHMQRLIESVWEHRLCLVHADFSPKNLLVAGTLRVQSAGCGQEEDSDGSSLLATRHSPLATTSPATLMMVDFETGHFGDPAFDVGFFLSHLVLKAEYHAPQHEPFLHLGDVFWEEYRVGTQSRIAAHERSELSARAMQNLAGCAWARLDGKSPVEYLTNDAKREHVRAACRSMFTEPPADWPAARALFAKRPAIEQQPGC